MWGLGSALLLYGIFFVGNYVSSLIFSFGPEQVGNIYNIRREGQPLMIALILFFITSPGEEIFWRGFLQKWAMARLGPLGGWLLAALVYGGVHLSSGNFMLTMAALTAGLFWGFIYMKEKSLVPVIISHAFWTVGIFVFFPIL